MMVHYQRVGKGHPFVLVHGFSGHTGNWRAWLKELPEDFDLIAMDLPDFGLTGPHPAKDYSTAVSVDFLDRFLTKIGVDTFHLAGNSMGGGIAWNYTLEHPERVKKLVLIDAGGYPKKSTKTISGFKLLEYDFLHPLITKITPRFVIQQSLEGTYVDQRFASDAEVAIYMDMLRREGNRQVLIDRRSSKRVDNSPLIPTIQQPTLVMWGDKDIVIPPSHAELFHRDLPNSQLLIYENVGHLPMDEIGKKSSADVKAFLMD